MPQFTARVYDLPIVSGQFSGSGFFTARMWPEQLPAVQPTFTLVAPLGGSIGTQTPWQARLELDPDDGLITRLILAVQYPSGVYEVIYINEALTPDYNGKSTIVQSPTGTFTMSIIRNGGWPSSPRIYLHANTDRGGVYQL